MYQSGLTIDVRRLSDTAWVSSWSEGVNRSDQQRAVWMANVRNARLIKLEPLD